VRDLHEPGDSGLWRHHDHQGIWEPHPGKVPPPAQCRKPLPSRAITAKRLKKGWPCLVGDVRREPARWGFKPGEPIRYWAILSVNGAGPGGSKLEELRLYELLPEGTVPR
jgi:hypothetical protein